MRSDMLSFFLVAAAAACDTAPSTTRCHTHRLPLTPPPSPSIPVDLIEDRDLVAGAAPMLALRAHAELLWHPDYPRAVAATLAPFYAMRCGALTGDLELDAIAFDDGPARTTLADDAIVVEAVGEGTARFTLTGDYVVADDYGDRCFFAFPPGTRIPVTVALVVDAFAPASWLPWTSQCVDIGPRPAGTGLDALEGILFYDRSGRQRGALNADADGSAPLELEWCGDAPWSSDATRLAKVVLPDGPGHLTLRAPFGADQTFEVFGPEAVTHIDATFVDALKGVVDLADGGNYAFVDRVVVRLSVETAAGPVCGDIPWSWVEVGASPPEVCRVSPTAEAAIDVVGAGTCRMHVRGPRFAEGLGLEVGITAGFGR